MDEAWASEASCLNISLYFIAPARGSIVTDKLAKSVSIENVVHGTRSCSP